MKSNPLFVVFAFSLAVGLGSAIAHSAAYPQNNPQGPDKKQDKNEPQISEEEAKAANAVNSAPDVAAKLVAADAFIKKYPKSNVRGKVADYVVGQIEMLADAAQRLAQAESFQKVFTLDKEKEAIQPVLILAYIQAKRVDEAFSLAASVLAKHPEDVGVLTQMAIAGTEEVKRQNRKYAVQTQQYGLKAIEIIEANTKPATLDDTVWNNLKAMLPRLYQSMGILAMVGGNLSEAKIRLERSVALDPSEPFNYVLLGSMLNDEYQQLAQSHKSMPEGKQKEETLKKATDVLDRVIDLFARAVGASQGRQEYQQLHIQILQDLTPYYKYRHNGSTEGLQQLIDKYKPAAKP